MDEIEKKWWNEWYKGGGTSGQGSRGDLLEFKSDYINTYFRQDAIQTVFDYGCGDGWLAGNLECKNYLGMDVSAEAVMMCKKKINRPNFYFELVESNLISGNYIDLKCVDRFAIKPEAIICIDMLYHVMDNELVNKIIESIFSSSARMIVLYTIPNTKMHGGRTDAINFYNNSETLNRVTKNWRLIGETEPKGISAAGFFIWTKDQI